LRYFDEARTIWMTKVPPNGQADTIEGELLRAVEKLRREAQANGNINWDEGFEILIRFLRTHLLDAAIYPDDVLKATRAILDRLSRPGLPVVEDGPYDELGDRVVEWYRHNGSRPHLRNPNLYR
jgi:hypothetical protein